MLPFDASLPHARETDELVEVASAFALEALDEGETTGYVRHLGACALCRRLAAEFQQVADAIPDALEPRIASAGFKERVLAPALRDLAQEPDAPAGPLWPRLAPARRVWTYPAITTVAAALVIGLVLAVAWNFNLRSDNDEQQAQLASQGRILEAIAAGGRVAHLKGTADAPSASATLVQSPAGATAYLLVKDLPMLPAGREYQVWNIKDGTPSGVGMFTRENTGEQTVVLNANLSGADAIGVSIEPTCGSPAPTGAIVLLGA